MLDEPQTAELDRLWDELHFVSQDALTLVDAFSQLLEYATQDADPKVFEPMRKPINDRAAAFRQELVAAEPQHLDAVDRASPRGPFAGRSTPRRRESCASFTGSCASEEIPHDEAIRLVLARVLVSPAFLYRLEKPARRAAGGPVSDWELASRLSYFLWSSMPDDELRRGRRGRAAARRRTCSSAQPGGCARRPASAGWPPSSPASGCTSTTSTRSTRRASGTSRRSPRSAARCTRRSILFFTDLFQNDGRCSTILDADYTFLNEDLAKHYGIPGVTGPEWRRVDGVRKYGRGGILAMAATLAKQSGASRTSPILRGNWVGGGAAGRKAAAPAQERAALPDDEAATEGLTVRQLVEKHTTDAALRQLPRAHRPVRLRPRSLRRHRPPARPGPGRPADRHRRDRLRDGTEFDGLDGLRHYLLTTAARRLRPAVLPQAAGLRPGPRRPAFRRTPARRDAGRLESERRSLVGRGRGDRAQPPVPRDSRQDVRRSPRPLDSTVFRKSLFAC